MVSGCVFDHVMDSDVCSLHRAVSLFIGDSCISKTLLLADMLCFGLCVFRPSRRQSIASHLKFIKFSTSTCPLQSPTVLRSELVGFQVVLVLRCHECE